MKLRFAFDVLLDPDRLQAVMERNGISLEDGKVVFHKMDPDTGVYTSNVYRTFMTVRDAIASCDAVSVSINADKAKYAELHRSCLSMLNLRDNIDGFMDTYARVAPDILHGRPRVEQKVRIKSLIASIGNMLKSIDRDQDMGQMEKVAGNLEDVMRLCIALDKMFGIQVSGVEDSRKILVMLYDVMRKQDQDLKFVDALVNKGEIPSTSIGKGQDVTKQLQDAIRDRRVISFTYSDETRSVIRTVIPRKLVQLKNGDALMAYDIEARKPKYFLVSKIS